MYEFLANGSKFDMLKTNLPYHHNIITIIIEKLLSVKSSICYIINKLGKQGKKIRPVTYAFIHITVLLKEIL